MIRYRVRRRVQVRVRTVWFKMGSREDHRARGETRAKPKALGSELGQGGSSLPLVIRCIFCKSTVPPRFAMCAQKTQTLADAVSTCPLPRSPRPVGAKQMGLLSRFGDFEVSVPPGEWAVETGHCERRETLPLGPSPQDLAHLVLSESMVWKRPSSSFSLRTPSAKKSWNSSKDNFPSSARKG